MARYTRYSGSFVAKDGTVWTCEISQESSSAFASIGDLDFPHSQPLVVEWEKREKYESIISSSATIRLISPTDRKFVDLYTTKAGSVSLMIKRNNVEWWRGFLDTEFYSEPYAYASGYEVQLTFSDFGILNRLKFERRGRMSIYAIINYLLGNAGHSALSHETIDTTFVDGTAVELDKLHVLCDNFYDEDNEPMNCWDVLEGVLTPLTCKIVQYAGGISIADIQSIATEETPQTISWSSDDSQLGVDKIYNSVKVTFSPYASADVKGGMEYNDTKDKAWTHLATSDSVAPLYNGQIQYGVDQPECYSFFPDKSATHQSHAKWDWRISDFTVFRSTDSAKCTGVASKGANNAFFNITPQGGGSEAAGVITGFYAGTNNTSTDQTRLIGIAPMLAHTLSNEAFATPKVYMTKVSDTNNTFVKVKMPLLFDNRYNPFTNFSDDNAGADREQHLSEEANIALAPVRIILYNASGTALYHWENKDIVQYARPADSVANLIGEWKSGAGQWGDAWLAYYGDDIMEDAGVGGWRDNRQCFGVPFWAGSTGRETISFYWKNLTGNYEVQPWWSYDSFFKAPAGQYIPYPPVEGYIEIRVGNGVWAFKTGDAFSTSLNNSTFNNNGRYSEMRWELRQVPEISVVGNTLEYDELTSEDIEYSGELDSNAQEALALNTIVGTLPSELATAKGSLLDTTGVQIHQFTRHGVTDSIEQLLIGTMHSQYATRHTVLSGEVSGAPAFFVPWQDAAQPASKVFMLSSSVFNAIENTTDAEFIEVSSDSYEGQ